MTTDPLKPGQIPGQNPNIPQRLQGEMKVGSWKVRPWMFMVTMLGVTLLIIAAVYATMSLDPGSRPANDPQRQSQAQ